MTAAFSDNDSVSVGDCEVRARIAGGFVSVHAREHDGRSIVEVTANSLSEASVLTLEWSLPNWDAVALWTARTDAERWLPVSFSGPWTVSALTSSPVGVLYAADNRNRLTFALSETIAAFDMQVGISGASARFFGRATFRAGAFQGRDKYTVSLSLDTRDGSVPNSLDAALAWWSSMLPPQLAAPAIARTAMYSTWYSLGQDVDSAAIERQAELAQAAGFGSIIIDDGWQTSDRIGGYSSCGDWEPDPVAFPDMASHVARVHEIGLSCLLWFALPFAGVTSEAYRQFQTMTLGYRTDLDTWVLDPRFPEVRTHLVERIARAVRLWGIDGVKIDFVDAFAMPAPEPTPAMDLDSVERAVVVLLDDLTRELTTARPDIMVEFRQSYVGPHLRSFANMIRVTDCAMDSTENRVHSLDLRLIGGATVVHSDMVMWHPEAPPHVAARQLIDILFSVPQISMRLEELSQAHRDMLEFWLSVFARYRTVLLGGRLSPSRPDLSYPMVRVDGDATTLVALYDAPFARLHDDPADTLVIVNGTVADQVVVSTSRHLGERDVVVQNCTGEAIGRMSLTLSSTPVVLTIPPSGIAVLVPQPTS